MLFVHNASILGGHFAYPAAISKLEIEVHYRDVREPSRYETNFSPTLNYPPPPPHPLAS
jgi:hypothetical protein